MNRKNAFSYLIWFLYAVVVGGGLLGMTAVFAKRLGQTQTVGMVVGASWLVLCGLITLLIHKLLKNRNSDGTSRRMPFLVAEGLVVVVLFAVGVTLRVTYIGAFGEESIYFDLAKVAEGQSIPAVVHGVVSVYLQLLHLVYLLFGNFFAAGIWLQIVLQMLAASILYVAVRKMADAVPALVMLGVVCVSPRMINAALVLSPEMLYLLVFAVALWFCIKCIGNRKGLIPCVLVGIPITVATYLDVSGVILLAFSVLGILLAEKEGEESLKRRIIGVLLCFVGFVLGFFGLLLIDALASGQQILDVLFVWWKVFLPSALDVNALTEVGLVTVDTMVLLVLMAFGIFSFWTVSKSERQSLWALALFVLLALQIFGMTTTEVNGTLVLYILASVLAGVGIMELFRKETAADGNVWDDGRLEAQLEAMSQDIEEAIAESEEIVLDTPSVEGAADTSLVEAPQVKFIENPLPLPKKHVKKVLDFDHDLEDGKDEFDIEISEDDDFDV